ncbi:SDR family oxidoreductase [Thalassospira sp. MCCC 1A01428]|uniref:SDR family NAD(P)-dependent oxidoreductase n=1 Tax=Thalassospira sp. MCCC 1A01428 TaxID=1470575 RepID=UPI000A1D8A8E|nr:SDR family NAD(P)-dependent oxidoreductase [Thalassospira sp. MCCC 1A01428]OSQ44725.1 short-chain dehydrogenase [Thalassospira sp. MCCC 1A01428]
MSLQYNAILITGASSGIGAALARYYACAGVTLFISGRNQARLKLVENDCRDAGANVFADILDVTDKNMMADYVSKCHSIMPLSLVIANAGISAGSGDDGETPDQVRHIMATNVDGVLNTIDPAVAVMKQQQRGQIAIMSSQASWRGLPTAPAYCASKAAVRIYGEALRGSLVRDRIRVNVICPGFVKSRITDANNFRMPFLMKASKAARIIDRGLTRNKATIAFPWQMNMLTSMLKHLPSAIFDRVVARLPNKPARRQNSQAK